MPGKRKPPPPPCLIVAGLVVSIVVLGCVAGITYSSLASRSDSEIHTTDVACRFESDFYDKYVSNRTFRSIFELEHLQQHDAYVRRLGAAVRTHTRTDLVSVARGSVITKVKAEYRARADAEVVARNMMVDGATAVYPKFKEYGAYRLQEVDVDGAPVYEYHTPLLPPPPPPPSPPSPPPLPPLTNLPTASPTVSPTAPRTASPTPTASPTASLTVSPTASPLPRRPYHRPLHPLPRDRITDAPPAS
ncbi:hypothetical protein CYMTET_46802 [Cymbomonas tetramitiformis]|uniref:Uncharacterized protein n=1 Tax=Cymbomonas tetramitiformis TaxID=36881 RepID=A0AAE0BX04_9CHLO|nr:hypothetical protein CYMTET_46802 [Cymbomonas tetramitiformis]